MKARSQPVRVLSPLVVSAVVVTLCGLALVPAGLRFMANRDTTRLGGASHISDRRAAPFKVSGSVEGLWPGARDVIRLRITNPNSFSIRVRSLKVKAASARPGCGARWMKFPKTLELALKVRKRGRASTSYPVQLSKNAPDACQGAQWPLKFVGSAEKVR